MVFVPIHTFFYTNCIVRIHTTSREGKARAPRGAKSEPRGRSPSTPPAPTRPHPAAPTFRVHPAAPETNFTILAKKSCCACGAYAPPFTVECILPRNERRDENGFSGIDSPLRGDCDKSTSSMISLNLNNMPAYYHIPKPLQTRNHFQYGIDYMQYRSNQPIHFFGWCSYCGI